MLAFSAVALVLAFSIWRWRQPLLHTRRTIEREREASELRVRTAEWQVQLLRAELRESESLVAELDEERMALRNFLGMSAVDVDRLEEEVDQSGGELGRLEAELGQAQRRLSDTAAANIVLKARARGERGESGDSGGPSGLAVLDEVEDLRGSFGDDVIDPSDFADGSGADEDLEDGGIELSESIDLDVFDLTDGAFAADDEVEGAIDQLESEQDERDEYVISQDDSDRDGRDQDERDRDESHRSDDIIILNIAEPDADDDGDPIHFELPAHDGGDEAQDTGSAELRIRIPGRDDLDPGGDDEVDLALGPVGRGAFDEDRLDEDHLDEDDRDEDDLDERGVAEGEAEWRESSLLLEADPMDGGVDDVFFGRPAHEDVPELDDHDTLGDAATDDAATDGAERALVSDHIEAEDERPGEQQSSAIEDLPPDDLTRIRGVGPKLRKKLTTHGVTHFSQLAELNSDGIDDLAKALRVPADNIRRDDWVAQARRFTEDTTRD